MYLAHLCTDGKFLYKNFTEQIHINKCIKCIKYCNMDCLLNQGNYEGLDV